MKNEQNNPSETNTHSEEYKGPWWFRNFIAMFITVFGIGITIFIAVYLMIRGSSESLDFIGKTLLPLWSTWIGTVLAFYFGKANFEAASKSYQEVIKNLTPEEKIAKLLVKDVMLPLKDIVYLDFETESPKLINEILKYPRFEPYKRFAVLDANKVVKCMIHRSTFYEFIYSKYNDLKKEGKNPDTDSLILGELINSTDEKIKNTLTRGFGFVSVNATLLDAKKVIDAIDECQDVFITETGKSSEPVLGLITNSRIFEKAKV